PGRTRPARVRAGPGSRATLRIGSGAPQARTRCPPAPRRAKPRAGAARSAELIQTEAQRFESRFGASRGDEGAKKTEARQPGRASARAMLFGCLDAAELVTNATRNDHEVAEIADVVRVDVHAEVPLVPLVADTSAQAELHVVRASRRSTDGGARHQIEDAHFGSCKQALAILLHHIVARAEEHRDGVHVRARATAEILVGVEV